MKNYIKIVVLITIGFCCASARAQKTHKVLGKLKKLPEHIIEIPNDYRCMLCKKNLCFKNGVGKHTKALIHVVNALYGYDACKIKQKTPFTCYMKNCMAKFNNIDDFLDHHIITEHTKNQDSCSFCKKHFISSYNLRRHFSRHLKKDLYFFKCPACQIKYRTEDPLLTHLKTCSGIDTLLQQKKPAVQYPNSPKLLPSINELVLSIENNVYTDESNVLAPLLINTEEGLS